MPPPYNTLREADYLKRLKWITVCILILFTTPLLAQYVPPMQAQPEPKFVYASKEEQPLEEKQVLVFFTHSQEAYQPVVAKATGNGAAYDKKLNILALSQPITQAFSKQSMIVDTIETDLMATMQVNHSKFHEAYKVARPYVQQALSAKQYDLVLDIHRDAAKKKATTLTNDKGSYAKIAIVIGLEHEAYSWNLAYAEQLHAELNTLVPNISRGVMKKEGEGVNGVYNQDLAQQMLLIEIGGVENTEQEVLNTIDVLAQAVRQTLQSTATDNLSQ